MVKSHYQIPALFVELKAFPLTATVKLDQSALAGIDDIGLSSESPNIAPGTSLETKLTQTWCKILQKKHIGTHNKNFDLGGHSLMAMCSIARLRELLFIEVTIVSFFETPTVAEFARALTEHLSVPITVTS